MVERRQLTEGEKAQLLSQYGRRCFVNGHPIATEDEIEFDHIRSVATGGPTTLDNMAPVCRRHNRQKRTMSLSEYRDYLALGSFFEDGLPKYLDDVVSAKGHEPGRVLPYETDVAGGKVTLYADSGNRVLSLYTCPVTSWYYFYALIPVQYLKNDTDLQPRALRQQSMWGLYRHFISNTQLAPSICRFDEDGQLLLFDGQHKAAAQIWAGRGVVECKVYVKPIAKKLKETNLEAHQSYRQMSFYTAELTKKYADIFKEDWEEYVALEGRKSEASFVEFLVNEKQKKAPVAKKEVAQALHWGILKDPDNKLREFISETTRTRLQPLTFNRVQKTIFKFLLSPVPNNVEFQSPEDWRNFEEANLVRLMTIIAEEGLIGRWDPERNDAEHQKADRIFSAGSIRAWTRILRDVLNASLQLWMISTEEVNRVFYRSVSDDQFVWIRKFVRLIFAHPVWEAPDTSDQDISKRLTKDDDTTALSLLHEHGLTLQYLLESAGRE